MRHSTSLNCCDAEKYGGIDHKEALRRWSLSLRGDNWEEKVKKWKGHEGAFSKWQIGGWRLWTNQKKMRLTIKHVCVRGPPAALIPSLLYAWKVSRTTQQLSLFLSPFISNILGFLVEIQLFSSSSSALQLIFSISRDFLWKFFEQERRKNFIEERGNQRLDCVQHHHLLYFHFFSFIFVFLV